MSEVVQGAADLVRKLRRLEKTVAKRAVRRGSRAGSKVIAEEAKSRVPQKSGELYRGIKVRALKTRKGWIGTRVVLQVPHGSFVDLGTRKMEPRPFLQDSFKARKSEAAEEFTDTVRREIVS